jgi:hypothetical protein
MAVVRELARYKLYLVGVQEVRWDKGDRNLVGRHQRRRPLGRPRRRWEDSIKMDLQEVEWRGTWTGLIWLRIGTGGGLL